MCVLALAPFVKGAGLRPGGFLTAGGFLKKREILTKLNPDEY